MWSDAARAAALQSRSPVAAAPVAQGAAQSGALQAGLARAGGASRGRWAGGKSFGGNNVAVAAHQTGVNGLQRSMPIGGAPAPGSTAVGAYL